MYLRMNFKWCGNRKEFFFAIYKYYGLLAICLENKLFLLNRLVKSFRSIALERALGEIFCLKVPARPCRINPQPEWTRDVFLLKNHWTNWIKCVIVYENIELLIRFKSSGVSALTSFYQHFVSSKLENRSPSLSFLYTTLKYNPGFHSKSGFLNFFQ